METEPTNINIVITEKKKRGRPKKTNIPIVEHIEETLPDIRDDETITEEETPVFDDEFLQELSHKNFMNHRNEINLQEIEKKETEKMEKELEKQMRIQMKEDARRRKEEAKQMKKQPIKPRMAVEDDGLVSEEGSEILGKERRISLAKIHQYKKLFPNELKTFRIKKGATAEELKAYLDEFDAIVSTSNGDTFMTDSILQCIKLIEGVSANTKRYNVSGLSEMLRLNPQFNSLMKQLYLKYSIFENIPPEYQLVLVVITSAYICKNMNSKREELNQYLNEPIPAPL